MVYGAKFRVGILGGQGPFASAEFHRRLLKRWAFSCGSASCSDDSFPEILHLSAGLPGLSLTGLSSPALALKALRARVKLMQEWGASLIVLPCNSLYPLMQELRASSEVPISRPWDAVLAQGNANASVNSLVLSSLSLRKHLANNLPATFELPSESLALACDQAIEQVAAGQDLLAAKTLAAGLSSDSELAACRNARLLLACTELSVIASAFPFNSAGPTWDAMDALVSNTLRVGASVGSQLVTA